MRVWCRVFISLNHCCVRLSISTDPRWANSGVHTVSPDKWLLVGCSCDNHKIPVTIIPSVLCFTITTVQNMVKLRFSHSIINKEIIHCLTYAVNWVSNIPYTIQTGPGERTNFMKNTKLFPFRLIMQLLKIMSRYTPKAWTKMLILDLKTIEYILALSDVNPSALVQSKSVFFYTLSF